MADTTVKKVSGDSSPKGEMGQVCLASGKRVSMRLWRDEEPQAKQAVRRDYETVGFVVSGRAELITEGQTSQSTFCEMDWEEPLILRGSRGPRSKNSFSSIHGTGVVSHVTRACSVIRRVSLASTSADICDLPDAARSIEKRSFALSSAASVRRRGEVAIGPRQ
jgi:hypothetical protein